MSTRIMSLCFDARFGSSARKAVALVLANQANVDGVLVYPSIAWIAANTELSQQRAERALCELEAIGLIGVAGNARKIPKGTVERQFNLRLLHELAKGTGKEGRS